ncbi:fungal zn(2)-Cys(6) binuclear cluster domain-containing protein [Purpureocillium lilacinum]|uniref:Fungal zn(2)-Cys(6) binuclear cluster domain-containing protein n=1 Tax=Purpureocillium lilacinum TaxID=33203 RepID=A0A179F2H9_PURLI|nr:fungal zn(2)-Cys(6) binuclear cluster domain-containing protein [Purpureocillium lilacinum]OAQ59299.1 fungal zn(2)-Cys(6) binuclear cluster domain-containing protein [Purpureocillium lilacinum]
MTRITLEKGHVLRPLLPRLLPAGVNPPASDVVVKRLQQNRRRFNITRVACEPCRKRKSKCDAQHPTCSGCARRQVDCQYETLRAGGSRYEALKRSYEDAKHDLAAYRYLIHVLTTASEEVSQAIIRRIKTSASIPSIHRSVLEARLVLEVRDSNRDRRACALP